jgi:hypothetical protein
VISKRDELLDKLRDQRLAGKDLCRHGKKRRTEHCRECALAGFCDCRDCEDHA